MCNRYFIFYLFILLINSILSYQSNLKFTQYTSNSQVYDISQEIKGDVDHKKAEFDFTTSDTNLYFKYQYESSTLPSSLITTFRFEFDSYGTDISNYKIYCTNVPSNTQDSELINILNEISISGSSCVDGFKRFSLYDGIVKLDKEKTKLGIVIKESKGGISFTGRVNLRIKERILDTKELTPKDEETYSLVPYTISITKFRDIEISKILFYSYSRNLQMFYSGSSSFPNKLFSGNILSVYTNPNMVRQKYHNAYLMTLLVSPSGFSTKEKLKEDFIFEVKLFKSNYLLDYYVSSNSEGRTVNKPLLINMTECTEPYYVILNYNRQEGRKSLILDQIYGKIKSLSIATNFTKNTWDEMIKSDMKEVNIIERRYHLPEDSVAHLDVYKIECELPLMLNFYYINEEDLISKMNYGDINIFTLKPYENVNIPFFSDVIAPEIIIEIYNPFETPTVIVSAQEENVYQSNTLIKMIPFTLANGITIKERAGLNDTRIIIKAGYSNSQWQPTSDPNVQYNSNFDVYAFKFPTDVKMYNYTLAYLNTSGTNDEDNVKYCFTTSIGAALKPSSENCYRVSSNNPYCLKVYNPLNMFKDYNYDESYAYYVTFKTEKTPKTFNIKANLMTYDTPNRNLDDINNKITIKNGKGNSILTGLGDYYSYSFLQIQVCDKVNSIKAKIKKIIPKEETITEKTIEANTKNNYIFYNNLYLDSEVEITGNDNTNIFLRYNGLPSSYSSYTPSFNDNYKITFDSKTNTLIIEPPITKIEFMRYTVIIDKENVIKNKEYTLCNFVYHDLDKMGLYHKSVIADGTGSIQINFDIIGFKTGQRFDAIVYIEQLMFSKMVFLSDVIQESVGEIAIDTIHEISKIYPQDNDYVYLSLEGKSTDLNYYFSYLPEKSLDVPFGVLRIELDETAKGNFSGMYCAFVNNDTDALGRIQEVEKMIDLGDSYCIGERSRINSRRYNYIFKYEKNEKDNTPKMLVIKLINGNLVNGRFNIYIRKEPGVEIEKTDFSEQKKYGEDENNKKSLIPYIVDLKKLRGNDTDINKISKILFYSQNSQLQMYYVPEETKYPIKLFSGNIALAYTKTELAIQKYHATTLILLSENIYEDEIDSSFRFHTKMFKSEDQIEFFVSQNPEGRTLNFPLSLEMNICTKNNKKLYYLLNYNKKEPLRTLHLDMVFGSYLRARIAREINENTWDDLISSGMSEIYDYQADLEPRSQHIDIIEIECISPLLINAYYTYSKYQYQNLNQGEIVIKELLPNDNFKFTVEPQEENLFFYSLSLYNQEEDPSLTIRFSDGTEHYFKGNTLHEGQLMNIPEDVTIINNLKSKTRIIFKMGLNVEQGKNWKEDDSLDIKGKLFVSGNKYVYKFPIGENKRSYTKIDFLIKGLNSEVENIKFCYSTNLGVAMEASRENCFRTGKYIPYTLTFINPLIVSKDYETDIDKYYIAFRPFEDNEYIKLDITENTYESLNRNEEGIAKQLTLKDKKESSILSLPKTKTSNIIMQLRSCTSSELPLTYKVYNAFTQEFIKEGKTYFYKDVDGGITYIIDNTNLETEIKLEADQSETKTVSAFLKHTSIGNNKVTIQDYKDIIFDDTKNSVTIKKPILNEEFIITIVVDSKGNLEKYTQCDFAFNDKSKIGKYSKTFTSVTSNFIIHFIDFSFIGFDIGTEFDLLVYAEEKYNSKLEFLYPLFQGKVGNISGVEAVNNYIDGDKYVTLNFKYNLNSNYLYYDFPKEPIGNSASLKIITATAKVTKVSCVFVSKYASDSTMISSVNNAMLENKNVCLDINSNNSKEFNALIKAKDIKTNSRLVIQVIYGIENNDNNLKEEENTINIKISGTQFGDFTGLFDLEEKLSPTPYIINLEEIRKKRINNKYVSKLLIYSNTTKMAMYHLSDNSATPLKLFSGNIMLIYTNPDVIYQKYNNSKEMILITDALGQTNNKINVLYFDSDAQLNYYLSNNEAGRVLNNPTSIEMTSCDKPYYYILNYNQIESAQRKMHLDTIFGEVESVKLAYSLDYVSWDKLINNMIKLEEEQIILPETQYPFDILEVKCKLPLLLNLYYADPNNIKTKEIEIGDIIIFSLKGGDKKTFEFKPEIKGPFAYSFNIYNGYNTKPNIKISFENEPDLDMDINDNGLFIQHSVYGYQNITFENKDKSSGLSTRIIFKFGYVIESIFTPIGNGVYQNIEEKGRTINLYGYKYDSTSKRLNYTGVDFEVSTNEENVKFCYSTNLGTYIIPSITNCYRVGKNNPYTISTKNPLIMFKNYFNKDINDYYVGFRTINLNQEIKITPKVKKYDTNERNLEGAKNKIIIEGTSEKSEYSTILTAPINHNAYIFTHIHVCTQGEGLNYEFYNAYSGDNLGYNGYIMADTNFNYLSIPNSKLDTELKLKGKKGLEIFIKHVGLDKSYNPNIKNIKFKYNSETHMLNWTQPIENEEFKYNLYIDKIDNIKNKGYTLCSIVDITKLGRYNEIIKTNSSTPYTILDFTKPELIEFTDFDVIIIAEQINNGKLTILSPVFNSKGESSDDDKDKGDNINNRESNTGLIIVIIVLSLITIGGGVAAFFIIRKYKAKGMMVNDGKATSMAMLGNTPNEKLVESQVVVDP